MATDNKLDYVNYDFDAMVKQLVDRLSTQSAWNDTYRSSTGQMLIELFAYVGNMVLYYIERRAGESFIETAQNRSSIINLVKILNYQPKRMVSSTGILTFTLSNGAVTKNVYIPRYTVCSTGSGVKYLVSEDVVILAGQTTVNASAIQGIRVTQSIVSSGLPSQEVPILNTQVENSNLDIYVGNDHWTLVSSFLTYGPQDKVYRLRYEMDDTITLIFGDGVRGAIPTVGVSITAAFVQSNGVSGNVYQAGSINVVESTIYDAANSIVKVAVTNSDTFLGGADKEDTEVIRQQAPKVFATGDRAVTKKDYIAILKNYPGVADANAWGEAEENPPNINMFNRVKIVTILQDWVLPTTNFKQLLTDYLYTKAQVTVKYEYVNADIVQTIPTIDIKVNRGNTLSQVQSDVEKAIQTLFVLGTTANLGGAKRISNMVSTVDSIAGVNYIHMDMQVRQDLVPGITDQWTATAKVLPIIPGTVEIYDNSVLVATDDKLGNLVPEVGFPLVGTVNYATGALDLTCISLTMPYMHYQQSANGDLVVGANQISKLHSIEINSISY